jgi:BTB/POZ domain/Leucine rich repeat
MDVQCKFLTLLHNGEPYLCDVQSANIKTRTHVKSFVGDHEHGHTNKSVVALFIHDNPNFHYIPRGIAFFFPNLVEIWISDSGLKEITPDDFLGLEHLEEIKLKGNKIKELPRNLFRNTRKLKCFTAVEMHLQKVDPDMFDSIPQDQWMKIHLCVNKIQAGYSPEVNSMKEFKDAIRVATGLKVLDMTQLKKLSSEGFKTLWQQKKFFDFTIIAGTKTFPVHKVVLAACSPVLAAMLENDDEVKATNKLEIKDCNEEVVEEFLQCLYTGEINEDRNRDALDLYSLAATFGVAELKSACEVIVLRDINEEDAFKALTVGNLHNSQEIIDEAFHKIKEKYPETEFRDELKRDPERIRKIIEAVEEFRKSIEGIARL